MTPLTPLNGQPPEAATSREETQDALLASLVDPNRELLRAWLAGTPSAPAEPGAEPPVGGAASPLLPAFSRALRPVVTPVVFAAAALCVALKREAGHWRCEMRHLDRLLEERPRAQFLIVLVVACAFFAGVFCTVRGGPQ